LCVCVCVCVLLVNIFGANIITLSLCDNNLLLSSSYTNKNNNNSKKSQLATHTHTHTLTRTSPHTRIQIHLYTSWHVSLSTRKRECDSHTRWSQCEKERKREYESECVENCLSGNNNKNGHRCDWWGAHLCLDADWRKSCCVPIAFSLSAALSLCLCLCLLLSRHDCVWQNMHAYFYMYKCVVKAKTKVITLHSFKMPITYIFIYNFFWNIENNCQMMFF